VNRDDWNARYAQERLVWGLSPNRFVDAELADLAPGRALDLACGEGRNAVWLAERGWRVTGIDFSDVAVARARRLAEARGVTVDLVEGDVLLTPFEPSAFDLVLISYLQLPAAERRAMLERAADALAPGGVFLLVAHDLRNLEEGHGGPSDPAVLWTAAEIVEILSLEGLAIERAGEVLREVDRAPRPAIDTLVRARRPAETAG
jgi:SAM-dependent methyltransferase